MSVSSIPNRSTHRYLDVMTVRPSQGARPSSASLQFNRPTSHTHSYTEHSHQKQSQVNTNSFLTSSALSSLQVSSHGNNMIPSSHHRRHSQSKLLSAAASSHLIAQSHQLANTSSLPTHTNLLIEPILLPDMQHVHVDNPQDLEESCLFYPNGHKNRNIRREIESAVVKHHIIANNKIIAARRHKDRYRIIRPDPYADLKGPPLVYLKKKDGEVAQLLQSMRDTESKIHSLVQIRV